MAIDFAIWLYNTIASIYIRVKNVYIIQNINLTLNNTSVLFMKLVLIE